MISISLFHFIFLMLSLYIHGVSRINKKLSAFEINRIYSIFKITDFIFIISKIIPIIIVTDMAREAMRNQAAHPARGHGKAGDPTSAWGHICSKVWGRSDLAIGQTCPPGRETEKTSLIC